MTHRILQPPGWPQPKGYSSGIHARGDLLFVGGMVGFAQDSGFPSGFVAQARQALINVVTVVAEGGGKPEHIVRLTWYVLSMDKYLKSRKELGVAYREIMGEHFPPMTLVEVSRLAEMNALLEIEATAVVP